MMATSEETRNAATMEELELLFTIGMLHMKRYYEKRPIRRFLMSKGVRLIDGDVFVKVAKRELSAVNYNYWKWESKYGNG